MASHARLCTARQVTGRQVAHDEPDLLLLEREQPVGALRQTLVLLERQLADAVKVRR
jgi:hypothetical protein